MISESIALELGKSGLCIWPDFLSKKGLQETRDDLELIQTAGAFARAGTGQGGNNSIRDLRRDETYWLDQEQKNPVQNRLWQKLDSLKQALNRTLFMGISSFEGHYASYPMGGYYRRHRDVFRGDDSRLVSFVLYLNQDWRAADGGRLRFYEGESHRDIDPVGGTLVCFLSRESEHEVMESFAARSSFTGWFKVPCA